MIKKQEYRLAEYRITETEDGSLWWETHFGFGSVKMGRCLLIGNTLFIEPTRIAEDNGFLKGEFIDQIGQLKKWDKSKYYSTSYCLRKCTPARLQNSLLEDTNASLALHGSNSYRLSHYEIIEKGEGQALWRSHGGRGKVKTGGCFVDDDVLFIKNGETELSDISKKDFERRLCLLPTWEKTKYYCFDYELLACSANPVCNDFRVGEPRINRQKTVLPEVNSNPSKLGANRESSFKGIVKASLKRAFSLFVEVHPLVINGLLAFTEMMLQILKLLVKLISSIWTRVLQLIR
ncbi:MAG TPA: hypothetical protein VEP29_07360 [Desulfatiglandales bacterium]|nr:hypothetical protein [Desulfatiglandales bacterium]